MTEQAVVEQIVGDAFGVSKMTISFKSYNGKDECFVSTGENRIDPEDTEAIYRTANLLKGAVYELLNVPFEVKDGHVRRTDLVTAAPHAAAAAVSRQAESATHRPQNHANPDSPFPRLLGETADGNQVWMKDGRFGPFVTDGTTFASLQKFDKETPERVTLQRALKLIDEKKSRASA